MRRLLARTSLSLLRPERLRAYTAFLESERLPAAELADLRRRRLDGLLRLAAARVPFYRDWCADSGLAPADLTAERLGELPRVSKREMTAARDRFVAEGMPAGRAVPNTTGGSSGAWFEFFIDRDALEQRQAADMRGRRWAGWRPGDRQAMLWGHRGDVAGGERLGARVRNVLFSRSITLNAYDMDEPTLAAYAARLTAWRPRLVIGYATALAFLAGYMRRQQMPPPPLGAIVSSAETLTDELRAAIEDFYRCPVLNRYGSREFGVVAQQCAPDSGLHLSADRLVVEILDPEGRPCPPGVEGEIVVTDLENLAMPFIRYRTGDLGVPAAAPCPCGRTLPLLERVTGRVSELIVGKNGKYYSCQSPRLFGADIPGLGQMQVIQDSLEEIVVKVVPDADWSDASRDLLRSRMRGLLGDIRVDIREVAEIPPSPSGKYRFTISSVSPFAT